MISLKLNNFFLQTFYSRIYLMIIKFNCFNICDKLFIPIFKHLYKLLTDSRHLVTGKRARSTKTVGFLYLDALLKDL